MSDFAVMIVAAGRSSRFQPNRSSLAPPLLSKKPFVPLAGKPVFLHSVERFARMAEVRQIILVVAPEDRKAVEEKFFGPLSFHGVELVSGGTERCHSVENALKAVASSVDFLAIHDAARPCISLALAEAVFDAAKRSGAAIPAARIVGTIKRARVGEAFAPNENEALAAMFGSPASEIKHERFVAETVPRSELWEAQTPQVFRRDLYERAVQERGDFIPTDDASLLERLNLPVAIVESDRTNIKITTQADLSLAEKLLAANRSR